MATSGNKKEPTRPLLPPYDDNEGNLRAFAPLSPKANGTRGRLPIPPAKVMPVIVIAGIMGSNLRANVDPNKPQNEETKPGEAAWRPPNGAMDGLDEATKWKTRSPAVRQKILDGNTLEVDPNGVIPQGITYTNFVWDEEVAKKRGWGEIHASSYGLLLVTLQQNLNTTYRSLWGNPMLEDNWLNVNRSDRSKWGILKEHEFGAELTDGEMKKFAEFHYPVYAFGYNWLKSNEVSADSLKIRIEEIISYWKNKKRQCEKVILVTHSMGGLVARACAKKIPEKITGVVHGVMPAIGAPACVRRLACGTETSSPGKGFVSNIETGKFAEIAGQTIAETTAVLATASGPLELLPNHLYPRPWAFVQTGSGKTKTDIISLPKGSPYEHYVDFEPWYKPIDPALADPSNKYKGNVKGVIALAVEQARKFHMDILDNYYHPNTFAFYGADQAQLSFGAFRWKSTSELICVTESALQSAKHVKFTEGGGRTVMTSDGTSFKFVPAEQDVAGDGTVPAQSGAWPGGRVRHLFRTVGYTHQGSYSNPDMLMLTQHLIVKLVQSV
jgi:hypothetical protein